MFRLHATVSLNKHSVYQWSRANNLHHVQRLQASNIPVLSYWFFSYHNSAWYALFNMTNATHSLWYLSCFFFFFSVNLPSWMVRNKDNYCNKCVVPRKTKKKDWVVRDIFHIPAQYCQLFLIKLQLTQHWVEVQQNMEAAAVKYITMNTCARCVEGIVHPCSLLVI